MSHGPHGVKGQTRELCKAEARGRACAWVTAGRFVGLEQGDWVRAEMRPGSAGAGGQKNPVAEKRPGILPFL